MVTDLHDSDPDSTRDSDPRDLSLTRRIGALSGADFWRTESIAELGVPAVTLTDGPHGLRLQPADADHLGIADSLPATCFPTASNLAASWDRELVSRVGAALGRECRSHGVGVVLGPGLNIKRHPGGGRNFEYFSEDPLVSGELAAAMVSGVQSEGVGACLKHYVANNHEAYRMVCDVVVDERTLRELYLRGFEIAVTRSRPWAVMTSYNLVNGEYVSESPHLVDGVLRDEWGFDGLVVTDWGGTHERPAAIEAGTDLEMPSSGGAHDGIVHDAIERGDLHEADVDRCVDRLVALARKVDQEIQARGTGTVDVVAHHRLARAVAAAGTVLLENDGVLPLAEDTDIAVIGGFATTPRFQGAGSSHVVPTRLDDARRHLEERFTARVAYAEGYDVVTGATDDDMLRTAADLAREVDVPIVFVGLPGLDEAEGCDRTTLALPPGHDALVTAVCAANPRTVVVLSNGAPVLLPWADRPAAILEAYLGGQASGSAIVDVLVGDAEPGGRLAESFPASPLIPAAENFLDRRRQVQYREGLYVGYRFHESAQVEPRYCFGHGRSYTTFDWSDPAIVGTGTDLTVEVTVLNTGERAGSDVVQVYVHHRDPTVYRPELELVGFAKVHLDPGESERVALVLDERSFAYYDVAQARFRVERGSVDVVVAASSRDVRFRFPVDVPGEVIDSPPPGAAGPTTRRLVASDDDFVQMLGREIPTPTPVLPFTLNTVIEELSATRVGSLAQAGFLRIAERQTERLLGPDPDPVLQKLSSRMIREAPLRFLVSMSGGTGSIKAFDGLTKLLSALRLPGRRSERSAGRS